MGGAMRERLIEQRIGIVAVRRSSVPALPMPEAGPADGTPHAYKPGDS